MRLVIRLFGWLLTLTTLVVTGVVVLMVMDSRPLVPVDRELSAAERTWAKRWLSAASPRGMRDGESATLTLSEAEANLIGAYLIDRLGQGRVAVRLEDGRARASASLGLPWDPQGSFLNLELAVVSEDGVARIESARFAGLPLPGGLVETLADRLTGALDEARLLERVELQPDLLLLTYQWHRDALGTLGSGLILPAERERLLHYQGLLSAHVKGRPRSQALALEDLLSHLLFEARHASGTTDPVAENRALILALAAYANRRRLQPPPGEVGAGTSKALVPKRFHVVTLRGRQDLAQHFLTSAALAAQAGNALSDLVGLYKEVTDSVGGSGFSFADLAADRAGTRFADLATGSREGALRVQNLAQEGLAVGDFMPAIDGLAEGLSEAHFAARFGDTKGPAYRRQTDEIERRIDALPVHQRPKRQAQR